MKQQLIDIQNTFLNEARKTSVPVTVFLVNGFQIRGTIKSFDNFIIEFASDGKQQLVYKHAISTVVPAKPVKLQGTAQI